MKQPVPFGKYTLLERISVGGMAEVFRAKTFGVEGFERLVAVKRILPNIAEDKEFIRMFVEEAKLAVQLNHANIAQIADLGVVDGSYYIAIEHVHGRDLKSVFERMRSRNESMPISHACFAAMKVCEGLDYAHNKRDQAGGELGLVHRDVSPQNVLVSFEGEVKLIDFGIAKAVGSTVNTQAGVLKGKIGYMSPEQVRGLPVDRRADVFSLGIVLYELLTGERLFVGESDFSTLEKVRNVDIPPPSMHNPKLPEELERIVLRALARDAGIRYQHAIDLHDDLQAFVYTAGEFCSRKDMAAWMKKTFAKEIDEETAKLEAFRQLHAAPGSAPAPGSGSAPGSVSRSTPSASVPPATRTAFPGPLAASTSASSSSASIAAASAAAADGRRTRAMGSAQQPGSRPPPPPPPGHSQRLAALEDPGATSSAKLLALTPPGALPALPPSTPRPSAGSAPLRAQASPSEQLLAQPGASAGPGSGAYAIPGGAQSASNSGSFSAQHTLLDPIGPLGAPPAPTGAAAAGTPAYGDGADSEEMAAIAAAQSDEASADWDDDEEDLETQIYDNDFDSAPVPKTRTTVKAPRTQASAQQAISKTSPTATATSAGARGQAGGPPSTAAGPRSSAARPAEPSRVSLPAAARHSASSEHAQRSSADAREASRVSQAPRQTEVSGTMGGREGGREASRVSLAPQPSGPAQHAKAVPGATIPPLPNRASPSFFGGSDRPASEPDLQAASQFGKGVLGHPARGRSLGWLSVVIIFALIVGAVALALTLGRLFGGGGDKSAPAVITDDKTGFDLYVVPAGITRWRLDGELRTDRLPSRIRGIAPGPHAVVIEAPPGFMSQSQNVVVEAGHSQKITIELPVMDITGVFRSDPDGATVIIIADGERNVLGPSPATYKLDPRKVYQVLFEKPGYVSANRPVTFSGLERESMLVVLEKADGATVAPTVPPVPTAPGSGANPAAQPAQPAQPATTPSRPGTAPSRPPAARPPVTRPGLAAGEPNPAAPAAPNGGEGTLQVSAKPPCEITIDGKPTGLSTPQREILLSVGAHRITLVNQEYGINETFTVEVKADAPAKLVRDFSDRLPAE